MQLPQMPNVGGGGGLLVSQVDVVSPSFSDFHPSYNAISSLSKLIHCSTSTKEEQLPSPKFIEIPVHLVSQFHWRSWATFLEFILTILSSKTISQRQLEQFFWVHLLFLLNFLSKFPLFSLFLLRFFLAPPSTLTPKFFSCIIYLYHVCQLHLLIALSTLSSQILFLEFGACCASLTDLKH